MLVQFAPAARVRLVTVQSNNRRSNRLENLSKKKLEGVVERTKIAEFEGRGRLDENKKVTVRIE